MNDALTKVYEKRHTYTGSSHDEFLRWLTGYVVNFSKRYRKTKAQECARADRTIIIADGQRRPGRENLVPCADMIEEHLLLRGSARPPARTPPSHR